MEPRKLWERYQRYLCRVPALGLVLDVSRMRFEDGFFDAMAPAMKQAFAAMKDLERGAISNPDEKRMVGHYWLRNPNLAPTPAIAGEILQTVEQVKTFAASVHKGVIKPPSAARFR